MLLINKPVNLQKKKVKGITTTLKRVWLEGKRLARHVQVGTPMEVKDTEQGIHVIFGSKDGTRTVSKRGSGETQVPVIEINEANSEFLKSVSEDTMLRIAITDKGIRITPNQEVVENRIQERETRTINKQKNGETMEIGSIFCGGGTFDFMGHKGFEKAGLSTVIRLAIDNCQDAMENMAENVSHVFDRKSILIESDISLLKFNDNMPKLDILKITPPCVDASAAGKAKKGNKIETSKTAHLVYYYSQLLDKTNPSYVIMENVPEFQSEASFLVFQGLLNQWGYKTQIRIIDAHKEKFALETRKRMFLVAESEGLAGTFDLEAVECLRTVPATLGEVLDDVAEDDKSWSPKIGLIEKQERDIKAGKGFRMQVFNELSKYIGTLRAQYQKSGSSDPLVAHPDASKKLFRIVNKNEHARCKGIDEALVHNRTEGQAHKILGNGLVGTVAEAICYNLAKAIKAITVIDIQPKSAVAA